jgi:mono/diheme cytochrome c family protein
LSRTAYSALTIAAALSALTGGLSPALRAAASPATPVFVIAATEQVERGKNLFQMHCAKCHGQQGEGGEEAPRLIASPHPIKGYKTAQALFDFVRSDMPFDAPGSLMAEVYWDTLAYILDANKILPPDTNLGPDNAGNIRIPE